MNILAQMAPIYLAIRFLALLSTLVAASFVFHANFPRTMKPRLRLQNRC